MADVGNTYVHLYEEGRISHLDLGEALRFFGERSVFYICVHPGARERIVSQSSWRDLSSSVLLPGAYQGMGVDRRALCLSRGDGLYIDAGTALTIDRVRGGYYEGGMILPGLHAYHKALASISAVLDQELTWSSPSLEPPKGTAQQLSYGIIAPICHEIERIRGDLALYVTGGDGRIVASWFENAEYSEGMVFEGMLRVLEDAGNDEELGQSS